MNAIPNPKTDAGRRFYVREELAGYSVTAWWVKDRCKFYDIKVSVSNTAHAHRVATAIRVALNECEVRGHLWRGQEGRLCKRCRLTPGGLDMDWWRQNAE